MAKHRKVSIIGVVTLLRRGASFIYIALLVLAGCGQEQGMAPSAVHVSNYNVVWSGSARDPDKPAAISFDMAAKMDETIACLEGLGVSPSRPEPLVVVLDAWFLCGDVLTLGCYDHNYNIVYLGYGDSPIVFAHELIHWDTGLGVEAHDSIYFKTCEK